MTVRPRPRIGIVALDRMVDTDLGETPHVTSRRPFTDRVWAAGGLPMVIPPSLPDLVAYVDVVDGLVLPGGGDIDPALYGQSPAPQTHWVDEFRDRAEVALVRAAMAKRVPILGICRGLQLINVAAGGTLLQHIEGHTLERGWEGPAHEVHLVAGTLLAACFRGALTLQVNTIHHQVVDALGPGLRVNARSREGYVEGAEGEDGGFVLAVQWHPELMVDPQQQKLFDALVAAAAGQVR